MMQPHTGEQSCSRDTTGDHQEESSTATRHEEVQFQEEQDGPENIVTKGEGEEIGEINMSLASTIPCQIVAGSVMDTPLIVLLHRGIRSSTAIGDIWVFVSLVDADSDLDSNSSARERDDVLKGQRADNAHPILGYLSTRDDTFAYASFPNLLISRSGRYRLRVTAIDMRFVKVIVCVDGTAADRV